MTGRYTALQVEFAAAVKTSAEQKELIFKLEHDLSTIQAMSSLARPDAEVHHTVSSEGDSSDARCKKVLESGDVAEACDLCPLGGRPKWYGTNP